MEELTAQVLYLSQPHAIQIAALVYTISTYILCFHYIEVYFQYNNLLLVFSGLHMGPMGILDLMFKDLWLRNHDSLKDQYWTISWWKCLLWVFL